jgi:O-acetyl-ADP-ribose deacetylase (regulator of RNase III)
MIRYTQGNLLDADAEALVNTVNEIGVMGKGVALMFREAFPENTRAYEEACRRHEVKIGKMFVTRNRDLTGPKWIINFPTKRHWRQPSKLEWIREGLTDLVHIVAKLQIRSIAIPPLGCGNGGLEWIHVRRELESALSDLPEVTITVFEPTQTYQNAPKRAGLQELTPARALIAEMIRRYAILGLDCTNLEVHKLAWFLHRLIQKFELDDPLKLNFTANKFGPYAEQLRHLLNGLDGSYIHCEKRLSDAGPFDLVWFEDQRRHVLQTFVEKALPEGYRKALEFAARVIDGFESPFGMELLSTVDWLVSSGRARPDLESVKKEIARWPTSASAARRKVALFSDNQLGLALKRLNDLDLAA